MNKSKINFKIYISYIRAHIVFAKLEKKYEHRNRYFPYMKIEQ